MTEKLSVITINYNNNAGLAKTIESVMHQTYSPLEYIIIDGGSTDGSVETIKKSTANIAYWISEPDKGIYNAMNKGILKATGEYVLFLNSGDHFFNDEALYKLAENNDGADIIYGDLRYILSESSRVDTFPETLSFKFFTEHYLPHPCTLIKRTLFDKWGLYDESLTMLSDWKFFLLAICKWNCSYLHKNVVVADFMTDGITSQASSEKKAKEERLSVLLTEFPALMNDLKYMKSLEEEIQLLTKNKWVKLLKKTGLLRNK